MTRLPATARDALRRARIRLKSFAYSGPARARWQRPQQVLDALGLREGERVADLGAGGGYFTERLARAVGPSGKVYAVEPDPDMAQAIEELAARQGLANVSVVEAPEDEPALPEPVDLVLAVNSLHHLPDPHAYLRGLHAHLRPGGRVAVIEALPRWYLFGHATDPAAIRTIASASGYETLAQHRFLPRQSFHVLGRPGDPTPHSPDAP